MTHPEVAEKWSVGRLIAWTADFLKRRGAESPRLDAEVLLADVLGWSRVQLYTRFEEEIGDAQRARYRELVRNRSERAARSPTSSGARNSSRSR